MIPPDPKAPAEAAHPTDEDLAILADAIVEGRQKADSGHVAGCEPCLATLAEFLRARVTFEAAPDDDDVDPELLALGRAVSASTGANTRTPGTRSGRRMWLPLPARIAGGVALAAGAAALFLMLPSRSVPPLDPETQARFESAPMAIPGLPYTWTPDQTTMRSGASVDTWTLREEVSDLEARFSENPTPELAIAIVGRLLQLGEIDSARYQLALARRTVGDHPDLMVASAVVSYRENRSPDAENQLRQVLQGHPTHAEALFNLGVVLHTEGDPGGAEILRTLARHHPHHALTTTAAAVLTGPVTAGDPASADR